MEFMFATLAVFTAANRKWFVRAAQEARWNLQTYDRYRASFYKNKQGVRTPRLILLRIQHVGEELWDRKIGENCEGPGTAACSPQSALRCFVILQHDSLPYFLQRAASLSRLKANLD